MKDISHLIDIDDYRPLIGDEAAERIVFKAKRLRDVRVVNVSSTYYGGGVGCRFRDRLSHYGIPEDRPIVTQISRFDR
jgi:hypothetical protein